MLFKWNILKELWSKILQSIRCLQCLIIIKGIFRIPILQGLELYSCLGLGLSSSKFKINSRAIKIFSISLEMQRVMLYKTSQRLIHYKISKVRIKMRSLTLFKLTQESSITLTRISKLGLQIITKETSQMKRKMMSIQVSNLMKKLYQRKLKKLFQENLQLLQLTIMDVVKEVFLRTNNLMGKELSLGIRIQRCIQRVLLSRRKERQKSLFKLTQMSIKIAEIDSRERIH